MWIGRTLPCCALTCLIGPPHCGVPGDGRRIEEGAAQLRWTRVGWGRNSRRGCVLKHFLRHIRSESERLPSIHVKEPFHMMRSGAAHLKRSPTCSALTLTHKQFLKHSSSEEPSFAKLYLMRAPNGRKPCSGDAEWRKARGENGLSCNTERSVEPSGACAEHEAVRSSEMGGVRGQVLLLCLSWWHPC